MGDIQNDLVDLNDLSNIPWSLSNNDNFQHSSAPWVPADPASFADSNNAADVPAGLAPDTSYGLFGDLDFDFNNLFTGVPATDQDPTSVQALEGPHTIMGQLSGAATSRSGKARHLKGRGPSAARWFAQKGNIKKLYIDEDKTLEETRKLMKDKYSFDATSQMYKDKFGDWGFSKNISRKVAAKLCRVADDRKPKDTTFRLGQKAWSAEDMRRKVDRASKDDTPLDLESPILPVELYWRTPSISPSIQNALLGRKTPPFDRPWTPSMLRQETSSPKIADHGRPWSPSISNILRPSSTPWSPSLNQEWSVSNQAYSLPYLAPPPPPPVFPWATNPTSRLGLSTNQDPLQNLLATSKWQGKSLRDLQDMRLRSLDMALMGKASEAISKLRFVVAGLQSLLAPTYYYYYYYYYYNV
ncbi:hypothetical protein HD806DRAFT_551986 [Xylariaceae sp. AK1471]|nr:hypothetical protein HD806DRAFT_551986 [Xylariaceae sp. AK1471]